MFFASFEVIVLILGGKVMTFILYPYSGPREL